MRNVNKRHFLFNQILLLVWSDLRPRVISLLTQTTCSLFSWRVEKPARRHNGENQSGEIQYWVGVNVALSS